MGSVKKIGREYFIEFFARGLKYQQKAGPDKTKAEEALQKIEEKIARGEAALIVRDVEYDIFFADFLENAAFHHPSRTLQRFQSLVEHFLGFLNTQLSDVKFLSQITPRTIELYKSFLLETILSSRTKPLRINFSLALLREIFQYSIKLGYLNDNPTLHIRFLPQPISPTVNWSPKELQPVVASCSEPIRNLLRLMLWSGLTPTETVRLKWSEVDFLHYRMVLSLRQPDPAGLFRIPLTPEVIAFLKEMKSQDEESKSVFSLSESDFKNLLGQDIRKKNQNLKNPLSIHSFRHAFAVHLIQKGVLLSQLYKILGEHDIARVMIYGGFIANIK